MQSAVAFSNHFERMNLAAEDLIDKIGKSQLKGRNQCGLLFCNADIDIAGLLTCLEGKLDFPIIGATSLSMIGVEEAFQDISAVLMVMAADDCTFSVSVSEPLTQETFNANLDAAYKAVRMELGENPKLIFAFPPHLNEIMFDRYTEKLHALSGGIPLIGGLPTHVDYGMMGKTVAQGRAHSDRLVLLGISGNIKPLFSMQNVIANFQEQKHVVTKAEQNIIYQVDNMTFVEYLASSGFDFASAAESSLAFLTNPLLIEDMDQSESDGVPFVRAIFSLNSVDGSGNMLGEVKQGSFISICALRRNTIIESSRYAIEELIRKIEENTTQDYQYTTIFCGSCIARHIITSPDSEVENRILHEVIPANLNFAGLYCYGEICPTSIQKNRVVNRSHNESIVMCAF